jgi:asparagine synthetase A
MKNKLKELLHFINVSTPIIIEAETLTRTRKLKGYDKPVLFNVVAINDNVNAITIFRCGCKTNGKNCGNVIGIEVLYHDLTTSVPADTAARQIQKVLPDIPVSIRDSVTTNLTKI